MSFSSVQYYNGRVLHVHVTMQGAFLPPYFIDIHFVWHCWPGWVKKAKWRGVNVRECAIHYKFNPSIFSSLFIEWQFSRKLECMRLYKRQLDMQIQDSMKSEMHENVHNNDGIHLFHEVECLWHRGTIKLWKAQTNYNSIIVECKWRSA